MARFHAALPVLAMTLFTGCATRKVTEQDPLPWVHVRSTTTSSKSQVSMGEPGGGSRRTQRQLLWTDARGDRHELAGFDDFSLFKLDDAHLVAVATPSRGDGRAIILVSRAGSTSRVLASQDRATTVVGPLIPCSGGRLFLAQYPAEPWKRPSAQPTATLRELDLDGNVLAEAALPFAPTEPPELLGTQGGAAIVRKRIAEPSSTHERWEILRVAGGKIESLETFDRREYEKDASRLERYLDRCPSRAIPLEP